MQPDTNSTAPHPKPRKIKRVQVYGYIIDPILVVDAETEKGTAIPGQFAATFFRYASAFAEHCGLAYRDLLPVRNPEPYYPPAYCVPVATNISKASKVPRDDVKEKAKEFLGTNEEPKWYYIVRI